MIVGYGAGVWGVEESAERGLTRINYTAYAEAECNDLKESGAAQKLWTLKHVYVAGMFIRSIRRGGGWSITRFRQRPRQLVEAEFGYALVIDDLLGSAARNWASAEKWKQVRSTAAAGTVRGPGLGSLILALVLFFVLLRGLRLLILLRNVALKLAHKGFRLRGSRLESTKACNCCSLHESSLSLCLTDGG